MTGADRGPFEERFWRGLCDIYFGDDACWEWQRYCCPSTGYGRMAGPDGHRKIGAHRASWIVHYGDIPVGMSVLHTCDNRRCVNPDHLFLGTHQDNMRDMREKGRGSKPPPPPPGRSADENRRVNKIRMGLQKTECIRGHELPKYTPGKKRTCFEPVCRDARRFNALGNRMKEETNG